MPNATLHLRAIAAFSLMLALLSVSPTIQAVQSGSQAPWVGSTVHGKKCSGSQVHFGPYDYRQRAKFQSELEVVEMHHFSPEIESLQHGITSNALGDIHYTLMAWPNHHRALQSSYKYRLSRRGEWPADETAPPAECYLQRAMKFSPEDPVPFMLHGILLHQLQRYDKALTSFRAANRLLPNDLITQYNMGLTLVALKKYQAAEQVAKKVYGSDFPLPGLKNKLIAAGHWKAEPTAKPSEKIAPHAKVNAPEKNPGKNKIGANEKEPKVTQTKFTETQLAEIRKVMQEQAKKKKAAPVDVELQDSVPAESVPSSDKWIDQTIVGE